MSPATFIAPSILSADFAILADEAKRMQECGADWLHVDCMDGHFVPNLTMGPPVVKSLRKHTGLFLDCHMMVSNPAQWIDLVSAAGADNFTFHLEALCSAPYDKDEAGPYVGATEEELEQCLKVSKKIREAGMQVGLALRPRTQLSSAKRLLDEGAIDMILMMTVEPGFGGQKFMMEIVDKIALARKLYPDLHIQVDGGVSTKTAGSVVGAGANVLVAGSAIFGSPDPKEAIHLLRNAKQVS